MNNKIIYLDNNSTVPLHPIIFEKLIELNVFTLPLNPSSIHVYGKKAKDILEESRFKIKNSIKAMCHEIIFCSSATESVNICFNSFDFNSIFAISTDHECAISHPKTDLISVDKDGMLDLNLTEEKFKNANKTRKPNLMSFCIANNQSGVLQDSKDIVFLCKKYNILTHCDASQFVGKEMLNIGMNDYDFDFVTISGHKIGAMQGSACLIYRSGLDIRPLMFGGGQEKFKRPSTQNIPAAVSLGMACEIVNNSNYIKSFQNHTAELKQNLEKFLLSKNCAIFGINANRVTNTTFFAMPSITSDIQFIEYDMNNILVSNGSACSSSKINISHVLSAMNVNKDFIKNAIRISTSMFNERDDIEVFKNCFLSLQNRI
jgi:cysteine desulfurase